MTNKVHTFVLDNVDSFIFNLVDLLYTLTDDISIYRNTTQVNIIIEKMEAVEKTGDKPVLLLSPGPKSPSDVPVMGKLMKKCKGKFPILGICLGHQAIIEYYGGVVSGCQKIMHGKKSNAVLIDHPIFDGLGKNISVARYHSLTATKMPDNLQMIAKTDDAVMAVADDANKVIGFQFHPESILTPQGEILLQNTFKYLTKKD